MNKVNTLALALVAVMAFSGCSASVDRDAESTDAVKDVKVTACTLAPIEQTDVDTDTTKTIQAPQATVEVTNSTKEAADYFVTVSFTSKDGGKEFGEGTGKVNGAEPGKSKTGTVSGNQEAAGELACSVTSVDRL